MSRLTRFLAFASTARHGSFARAARELGLTPSSVAKSVASLEAQLGVRLFHRTTRQVGLTSDGAQLYQRCQRVLSEVEELEAAAAGVQREPSGVLCIDAPLAYGKRAVLPVLAALMAKYPALRIEANLSDEYCDPVRDGLDAVVRVGKLADSRLAARRIDRQYLVTCAAPAYLKRAGTPQTLADIAAHDCILFRVPASGRLRTWPYRQGRRTVEILPAARLGLNHGEAMVAAAEAGAGLTQVPDYMVADAIAARRLVPVLDAFRAEPMPIHVVYPSQRHVTPRLRAFIDAMVAARGG